MRELTPEEQQRVDSLGASTEAENSNTKFGWDDTFQSKLLGALLTDGTLAPKAMPLVDPKFFSNEAHVILAGLVKDYWTKYKALPERFVLDSELAAKLADRDKAIQLQYQGQLEAVLTFHIPGLHSHQYILDKLTEFAKVQAVKVAFHKVVEVLNERPDKVDDAILDGLQRFRDMMKVGNDQGSGLVKCATILNNPDMEWLVDTHFPTDSLGIIFGKYGSLKSFYALELALSVASGRMFLGTHPTKAGAVVYIAGEGQAGYKKRLMAWLKHNNIDTPPDNFFMIFNRFDFADAAEGSRLLGMIEQEGVQPALVIIDTVAQNLVGDENGKEMSRFLRTMADIRDGLPGACVLGVHHTGKDESRGPRGFSGIGGNVDVVFEVKKTDAGCEVRAEKVKDAELPGKYLLDQVVVDLGADSFGKPLSSLVLVPDQGTHPSPVALARLEEQQEEEDVLGCIPWLTEADWRADPEAAATRETIATTLNWSKDKTRSVLERLQRMSASLKWRKFKEGRTNPYYYWRDKDYGCATSVEVIGEVIGDTQ